MKTYSVSDVADMLNVTEETVRRWVRRGKINSIRRLGRAGNILRLEDVVEFANHFPKVYLVQLELWLIKNGIGYLKNTDSYNDSLEYSIQLSTDEEVDTVIINDLEMEISDENRDTLNKMNVSDIFEGIKQAKNLLDNSIITEEEFLTIKTKLIAKI